jgi:S1-C subfamily serine protease
MSRRAFSALAAMMLMTSCGGGSHRTGHKTSGPLTPEQMSAYDDAVRLSTMTTCGKTVTAAGLTDGHLVLTTAHAVAGARTTSVTNRAGQQVQAHVVAFDPQLDIAWLYAPGLPSKPTAPAGPADTVAPAYVFAFPATGSVVVYRSAVLTRTSAAAPDAYGKQTVTRNVYTLTLDRPAGDGIDGAAVLDHDGRLLGIVFATSGKPTVVTAIAGDDIAASSATHALSTSGNLATAKPVSSPCL